jgi:hypothetical protein
MTTKILTQKNITLALVAAMLAVGALIPLTTAMAASPARGRLASAPQAYTGDNFYALNALSRVFGLEVAQGMALPQSVLSLFGDNLNAFFGNYLSTASSQPSITLSHVPLYVHEVRGF